MNQQRPFTLSERTRDADAKKAARASREATRAALKSRRATLEVQAALEGFAPGVLNDEEQEWALTDPDLAKFLVMCSQKELDRMRAERAQKAA